MTDLRETVARIIADGWVANHGPHEIADAALSAMGQARVKDLVWEDSTHDNHEGCVKYAETATGTYFICYDNDDFTGYYCHFVTAKDITWFGSCRGVSLGITSGYHDDDLNPIKAAAQAHHNAAILSALEPTLDPVADAAKVLLETSGALDEMAKSIAFCTTANSYQKLRIGLHYTIDPTGQKVPDDIVALFDSTARALSAMDAEPTGEA